MPSDHHYHHQSHREHGNHLCHQASNSPSCCSSCCRSCNCSSSSPLPPSLSGDQLLQYLATDLIKIQSFLKPQQIHSQSHHDTQSLLQALLRRVTAVESSLAQLSSHSPPNKSPPPSSSRRPLSPSPPPPPPSTSHPIPSLREVAARTIQARFRRFLVRRSQTLGYLKRLASIKSNMASLRSSISGDSGPEPEALSRKTMDLLLQLDSIQSSDPMIRDGKRAISRELTGILDFVEKVLVMQQRRFSLQAMDVPDDTARRLPRPRSAKKVSFQEHGGRIREEEKDRVSRVLEEEVFAFGNGTYSHGQSDGFGLSAPLPLQMEPRRAMYSPRSTLGKSGEGSLRYVGQPHADFRLPLVCFWIQVEFSLLLSTLFENHIFIIASSSLIAIESVSDISLHFLVALLKVVAAFSCLIISINGINELYDIEIDKINKPYLPLASGEMTIETGVSTVSYFALMAFAIGISIGSTPLLWGIFLFFIILSAYSVKLPFLRWKNSAIGAASSIFTSYGIVLPVSSYLHMQTCVFGRQANFPRPLAFGTSAISLFFIVVALFKDIPDIEGDQKFGILSLATRLGQKKVFWICVYLLELVYTFAIVVGAASSHPWSKLITVVSHVILSLILWKQARSTNYKNKSEITSFYQFIWKLLYAECLLIPLVR